MQSRRSFLRRSAAALGAAALSGCPAEPGSSSSGRPWGDAPDPTAASLLTPRPLDGVLEFFLTGGVNAWDSFYVVPEFGDPERGGPHAGTQWWTFQDPRWGLREAFERCGGLGREMLQPFGLDAAGRTVHLGPFLLPLRDRPDLLARMRLLVMRHRQAPHQTAIPLALTGHRFGSPRMAGTAAHVQRRGVETAPRPEPHAYVLYPMLADLDGFNGDSAGPIGLHPGTARPLELHLGFLDALEDQLRRARVAGRPERIDTAVDFHRRRLLARLTPPGAEEPVRARLLDDYAFARSALADASALLDLLPAEVLRRRSGERCGAESSRDQSAQGLDIAVHLLTGPRAPRWVTCLDGGLRPAQAGLAYDTHDNHVPDQARNLTHSMAELAARINEPGENDPSKLDLDRHQVLITTEFGRSPRRIERLEGLEHWPEGYVQVLLGGVVGEEQAGVIGAIGEDGHATDFVTPADFRAAMLCALGIWPFSPESFAVGDLSWEDGELEAVAALRERVLGHPA